MESSWWLSSGAAMFLFFNVLIGAVVVMSRGQQGGQGRRLCRSASSMVLGRLRSFSSMFSVHPSAECYYHTTSEAGELQASEAAPEQAVLEPAAAEPPSATAAAGALASVPADEKCASMDGQQDQALAEPLTAETSASSEATAVVVGERKKKPAKEAPPESSKRRARASRREAEEVLEGKAQLNARAEVFIHQFREDLKLQRLNSIINYTRGLRRRAGAALSQD